MKKISIFLFSFIVFNHSILLAYSSDPSEFVNELVTEAISKLSDKNLSKEEKSSFIEKVAKENVDINALGLYTLGELMSYQYQNLENFFHCTYLVDLGY